MQPKKQFNNGPENKYATVVADFMSVKEHRRKLTIWVSVSLILTLVIVAAIVLAALFTRPKPPLATNEDYLQAFGLALDEEIKANPANKPNNLKANFNDIEKPLVINFTEKYFKPARRLLATELKSNNSHRWDLDKVNQIHFSHVEWSDSKLSSQYLDIDNEPAQSSDIDPTVKITIHIPNLNNILINHWNTTININLQIENKTNDAENTINWTTKNNIYNFDLKNVDSKAAIDDLNQLLFTKDPADINVKLFSQNNKLKMAIDPSYYHGYGMLYFSSSRTPPGYTTTIPGLAVAPINSQISSIWYPGTIDDIDSDKITGIDVEPFNNLVFITSINIGTKEDQKPHITFWFNSNVGNEIHYLNFGSDCFKNGEVISQIINVSAPSKNEGTLYLLTTSGNLYDEHYVVVRLTKPSEELMVKFDDQNKAGNIINKITKVEKLDPETVGTIKELKTDGNNLYVKTDSKILQLILNNKKMPTSTIHSLSAVDDMQIQTITDFVINPAINQIYLTGFDKNNHNQNMLISLSTANNDLKVLNHWDIFDGVKDRKVTNLAFNKNLLIFTVQRKQNKNNYLYVGFLDSKIGIPTETGEEFILKKLEPPVPVNGNVDSTFYYVTPLANSHYFLTVYRNVSSGSNGLYSLSYFDYSPSAKEMEN